MDREQFNKRKANRPTDTETLAEVRLTDAEREALGVWTPPVLQPHIYPIVERIIAARIVQARAGEGALLCSQCGERLSCMVKIGTADGWCSTCLDEAAEGALRERERLHKTMRHWRGTDEGLRREVMAEFNRILAARRAAQPVRVEIEERIDEPTTCKIWRNDQLIFDGIAKSVPTPEAGQIVCPQCRQPVETLNGHWPICPKEKS